mmetsp:Transcript_69840/g.177227  ORF Transcript_69840/g.177227 Transcript_69840/m.177227 type:complete len:274 (+) Transcript_69840:374-1195(+)
MRRRPWQSGRPFCANVTAAVRARAHERARACGGPSARDFACSSATLHGRTKEAVHASALRQGVQRGVGEVEAEALAEEAHLRRVLLVQRAARCVDDLPPVLHILQSLFENFTLLRDPAKQPVVCVHPLHVRVPPQGTRLRAGGVYEDPVHLGAQLRQQGMRRRKKRVVPNACPPQALFRLEELHVPVVVQKHLAAIQHRRSEGQGLAPAACAEVQHQLPRLGVDLLRDELRGLVLDFEIAHLVLGQFQHLLLGGQQEPDLGVQSLFYGDRPRR